MANDRACARAIGGRSRAKESNPQSGRHIAHQITADDKKKGDIRKPKKKTKNNGNY